MRSRQHVQTGESHQTFAASSTHDVGFKRFLSVEHLALLLASVVCFGFVVYLRANTARGDPRVLDKLLSSQSSCAEQFDVVYTWVNGSDPVFREAVKRFSNSSAILERRYWDRDELKYSLRSLEKYAPWVGQVYLVTNGQVPNWLNVEKVKVVTHEEIFEKKEHLPTFSSPAIEANIHRIPGLSKRFLYMNDDMVFGAPVYPEDFISNHGVQRVYLAWELPDCAPQCPESFIGDRFCDMACNVSSCGFDGGDCLPKPPKPSVHSGEGDRDTNEDYGEFDSEFSPLIFDVADSDITRFPVEDLNYCSQGCAISWLGDGICDASCKNEFCGFDAGDCPRTSKTALTTIDLTWNETIKVVRPMNRNPAWFTFLLKSNITEMVGGSKVLAVLCDQNDFVRSTIYVPSWEGILVVVALKALDDRRSKLGPGVSFTNTTAVCAIKYSTISRLPHTTSNEAEVLKSERLPHSNTDFFVNFSFVVTKGAVNMSVFRDVVNDDEDDFSDVRDDDIDEYANDALIVKDEDSNVKSSLDPKLRMKGRQKRMEELQIDDPQDVIEDQIGYDSFGRSLVHTRRTLQSVLGRGVELLRKVPAHMPLLIEKRVLENLHRKLHFAFERTSSHKFRSDDDVQFEYAYLAYLMAESDSPVSDNVIWAFLDTDSDGCLNQNEFRTFATFVLSSDAYYATRPPASFESEDSEDEESEENDYEEDDEMSTVASLPKIDSGLLEEIERNVWSEARAESLVPIIDSCLTLRVAKRATRAFDAVASSIRDVIKRSRPLTELADTAAHVSFAMLKDKRSQVLRALDALRARPTKFVCINDDTTSNQTPGERILVDKTLRDLYNSWFPYPSRFERSLDEIDETQVAAEGSSQQPPHIGSETDDIRWKRIMIGLGCLLIVGLLFLLFQTIGHKRLVPSLFKFHGT